MRPGPVIAGIPLEIAIYAVCKRQLTSGQSWTSLCSCCRTAGLTRGCVGSTHPTPEVTAWMSRPAAPSGAEARTDTAPATSRARKPHRNTDKIPFRMLGEPFTESMPAFYRCQEEVSARGTGRLCASRPCLERSCSGIGGNWDLDGFQLAMRYSKLWRNDGARKTSLSPGDRGFCC